jgi:DNA-binding NarL/FixJ family response regulator
MQIAAEAATGWEVLDQLEKATTGSGNPDAVLVPVDLVLMDIDMPELNGIEATRLVRERFPAIQVIMLTMADHEQWVRQSLDVGAQGYVLKSAGRKELLHAIRTVYEGEEYFSTDLMKLLIQKQSLPAGRRPTATASTSQPNEQAASAAAQAEGELSSRELEVLRLIAKGYTNYQISDVLFISRRTVETHRQHLLEKTGSTNTATLIRYAVTQGLLEAE